MISKLWDFLQKAMSEAPGEPSAMRFNTTYVVIAFASVVAIGFLYVLIAGWKDLVLAYAGILITSMGSALYFKRKQRGDENEQSS